VSKVYYDRNGADGGSVPEDYTDYNNGDLVTVLGNTGDLFKKNNEFAYWTTTRNDLVTVRDAGTKFKMNRSDIILKAQWYSTEKPKEQVTSHQLAISLVGSLFVLLSTVMLVLILKE
jgi:hypothetical protein